VPPPLLVGWFFLNNPVMVIALGTNDGLLAETPEEFEDQLYGMLDNIREARAQLNPPRKDSPGDYLFIIMPTDTGRSHTWEIREQFAQVQLGFCDSSPIFNCLDLREMPKSLFPDDPRGHVNVHPSASGQSWIAERVTQYLRDEGLVLNQSNVKPPRSLRHMRKRYKGR
jgi:hypothetical protein